MYTAILPMFVGHYNAKRQIEQHGGATRKKQRKGKAVADLDWATLVRDGCRKMSCDGDEPTEERGEGDE